MSSAEKKLFGNDPLVLSKTRAVHGTSPAAIGNALLETDPEMYARLRDAGHTRWLAKKQESVVRNLEKKRDSLNRQIRDHHEKLHGLNRFRIK